MQPEGPDDGPPAHWLARVSRNRPPTHWLEHVHEQAPRLRFQHYRATSGPPAPMVRRTRLRMIPGEHVPRATDATSVQTAAAPGARNTAPRPAAMPRRASRKGVSTQALPTTRLPATRREVPTAVEPLETDNAPDPGSLAAAASLSAAAQSTPIGLGGRSSQQTTGTSSGRIKIHLPETGPTDAARLRGWLAQVWLFLSGRNLLTVLRRGRSSTPARRSDLAPEGPELPFTVPAAEGTPVPERAGLAAARWALLPGEPLRTEVPDKPADAWGASDPSPWPDLPPTLYGPGEVVPEDGDQGADLRAMRRRQRLDDEQRGLLWTGSIY